MTAIAIPKEDAQEFLDFINKTDGEFEKVIKAINSLPLGIGLDEIDEKLNALTLSHIKIIKSLFLTYVRFDLPKDEFIALLYNEYKEKAKTPIIEEVKFIDRFSALFNNKNPLRVSIKAWFLSRENQKTLIENRIITEVRPVFSSKKEEDILGSVIVHQLKLVLFEDNGYKSSYFSMDKKDLADLKATIERAMKKQEVLENGLKGGDLKTI